MYKCTMILFKFFIAGVGQKAVFVLKIPHRDHLQVPDSTGTGIVNARIFQYGTIIEFQPFF